MDELKKLEHLSLVSKICTELENHLNLNDKDLAEFIIDLADRNSGFDAFKRNLIDNGAEFSDSLIANLYRVITHMKKTSELNNENKDNDEIKDDYKPRNDIDLKKVLYPFLAMPNNPAVKHMLKDEIDDNLKQESNEVLDLMAQLESLEQKSKVMNIKEEDKKKSFKRHRSRSTSRSRRKKS